MKKCRIGGQAVIEGVMMKNYDKYAVAVRKPDDTIDVKVNDYVPVGEKVKLFKLPFIRGIFNFIESLVVGFKTLTYSASFYEEEEEETVVDKAVSKIFKDKAEDFVTFVTVILSIAIAIGLFMLLPAFLVQLLEKVITSRMLRSVIEGIIRLLIFIIYVALISMLEDIKRTFMYHGAEHKTINCLEAGDDLTPENVLKHSRYHKRCGTSFLFVVMMVSIVVFMFINTDSTLMRMVYRVLLVPVVASISYEFIMLAGRNDSEVVNILSKPGLWVQRLTTKEPDLKMAEVAIASVEAVLDWRAYLDAMRKGELED
ncbi:MAG: DUF1385 domain-containing protein [Lachnospiraceae bacterium]|nr:DUF1385 domain-containing protein [Lachnospiraceae bacterium]